MTTGRSEEVGRYLQRLDHFPVDREWFLSRCWLVGRRRRCARAIASHQSWCQQTDDLANPGAAAGRGRQRVHIKLKSTIAFDNGQINFLNDDERPVLCGPFSLKWVSGSSSRATSRRGLLPAGKTLGDISSPGRAGAATPIQRELFWYRIFVPIWGSHSSIRCFRCRLWNTFFVSSARLVVQLHLLTNAQSNNYSRCRKMEAFHLWLWGN